jgi:AraC-like DNA-binding protein
VVLNIGLGMNFYDFINEYRIEEVKEQLLNPKNNILTNVAVAYDSGFNSKSTFNALFKKYVKMTPKDYKKQFAISQVE